MRSASAPTAEGSFTKTPFAHLLVYALDRRLDGTFEITAPGGAAATLVVAEGKPTKVKTTALPSSSGSSSSGDDEGADASFDVVLERLFGLPADATFAFYDGVDALATDAEAARAEGPFDPFPVLWRGIRQSPSWEHVDVALRRVATHAVRLGATAETERFAFGRAETAAVELLRAQALRVTDVASSKALGPSAAQLLVYCLLITKQVDIVEAVVSPPVVSPPTPDPEPAPSAVPEPVPTPLPARAPAPISSGSIAAVPPAESSGALPPPPGSNPSIPQSSPGGQAFARVQLQRQVQRPAIAVEESVAVHRRRDRRVATPTPPPLTIPPLVDIPESPAPKVEAPQAPPPSGLSPEQEALKTKILERAGVISALDYFEMLGVTRDTQPAEVQKAFIGLAKVWHPDRLPMALAEVKDACSKVFSHLTEANATLTDPKRRETYMTLMKDGGATPDEQAQVMAVVEAATEFQKAEIFLKRNEHAKAYEHAKRAHALDNEQSDYLALITWLEALRPDALPKDKTLAKIQVLDGCIMRSPNSERAHFYRGQLYKRIEDTHSAVRDFKRASELNPRNVDAAREVRLYNMRAAAPKTAGSMPPKTAKEEAKGFLGKLFKK